MEQVLDLYARPPDEHEPLVAMDETFKELHAPVHEPLPAEPARDGQAAGEPRRPGKPRREDDKFQRRGAGSVFLFLAPHLGWRRASARARRCRVDWAQEVRRLLEQDFPAARRVHLVCDNLNTHSAAALYAAFAPEVAHRLMSRLTITYTPRNGSWLNVAEIDLSVLSKQCLRRRIPDMASLAEQLRHWAQRRNHETSKVSWQFTTADARVKLAHLYPKIE